MVSDLMICLFPFIMSLNPCCNGIWSQTLLVNAEIEFSLNPCCNGIWSQTYIYYIAFIVLVLILVVMEYGLRRVCEQGCDGRSLNPCCNGIWSQTGGYAKATLEIAS